MKIYDYGKTKNCFICGNIDGNINKFIKMIVGSLRNLNSYVSETHPKELERQERLNRQQNEDESFSPRPLRKTPSKINCGYDLTESIVIVNGFNGFGERELKYYYDKLEMLNKILADNNTHVLFVRGNDDPKYFEDGLIDLSNVKTIQDYSVVKLNKFNCLCIGGCISLDRTWKIEQEKRIGRKLYWENEKIQYNENDITKIIKDYNIACVVSSSCPSFAYPGMNSFKHTSWASKDKTLIKDLMQERMIMDKIYYRIVENNKKPYLWVYSRFKNINNSFINDILFQSLNSFQFFHCNHTISSFFKVNFSKSLKENEYVSDSFGKKIEEYFEHNGLNEPFGIDIIELPNINENNNRLDTDEEVTLAEITHDVYNGFPRHALNTALNDLNNHITNIPNIPIEWHTTTADIGGFD
jgi:Icc-related predicted phosphoesterase